MSHIEMRVGARSMQRILSVLTQEGPLTLDELAPRVFLSPKTLAGPAYIRTLRKYGLIHIAGYRPSTKGPRPLMLLDVPR